MDLEQGQQMGQYSRLVRLLGLPLTILAFVLMGCSSQAVTKDDGPFDATVNITQNGSGRLGENDKADEDAYKKAKDALRNPDATKEEVEEAEKTLDAIYSRKKEELQQILGRLAEFTDAEFSIEDAGGSWMGGEEYSFKVGIRATTQEDYDKALQALSYVAEGLRQDAFIENLGEVDESEVTDEGLLRGDYTPTIHISFARTPTAREVALIQKEFLDNSTDDLPLDATITDSEIALSFPSWKVDSSLPDEEKIGAYKELLNRWSNKIAQIAAHGKEGELEGAYSGDIDLKFERSRLHSADSTEGEERRYSAYRNSCFPATQQQGLISEEEGREIREYARRRASPQPSPEGKESLTPALP